MGMITASIITGYLIGNINFSYLIVKIFKGVDIREYGSGNAGATNVYRIIGTKGAVAALAGDLLKGVAAVIVGRILAGETGAIFAAVAVVTGHNWPAVLGFKGGKGIATSLGILLSLDYRIGFILITIGIIIIIITRYVSLASVTGAIVYPFLVIAFGLSMQMRVFATVLSIFAIYRHRANIGRLFRGEESKIAQKVELKKEEDNCE